MVAVVVRRFVKRICSAAGPTNASDIVTNIISSRIATVDVVVVVDVGTQILLVVILG